MVCCSLVVTSGFGSTGAWRCIEQRCAFCLGPVDQGCSTALRHNPTHPGDRLYQAAVQLVLILWPQPQLCSIYTAALRSTVSALRLHALREELGGSMCAPGTAALQGWDRHDRRIDLPVELCTVAFILFAAHDRLHHRIIPVAAHIAALQHAVGDQYTIKVVELVL